jgi:serine/threonine protein kinase
MRFRPYSARAVARRVSRRDTKLGRDVALNLKYCRPRRPKIPSGFPREGKALAQLNHPNIVTIHAVEESSGMHFLTMQQVEGLLARDLQTISRRSDQGASLPVTHCEPGSRWREFVSQNDSRTFVSTESLRFIPEPSARLIFS